ncbi:unnamed protein product [Rhizoctonia solani]|uniref:Uncharacterized protein n=1 Tax=Rhizoctonia solani TaxID=456999 RepID=A0A8H3HDU1_9AGAM|nr:unnamed protein product [Rhizoctonia solani]
MPAWTLKSTAAKMLQNLSSNTAPRQRKGSIDVHVHTQRSYFVEPSHNNASCDHIHRSRLAAPYALPPKYEKEISGGRPKPRPNPLKIRNVGEDENWTPGPDEKAKGTLVDRNKRRYGMMYYPEGVRDELRRARTRSRSPRVKTQLTPSPTSSFCSDQIIVSSARHDKAGFEPPSWFSIASESEDPSRFSLSTSDEPPSGRILSVESAPVSPKSWETFRIPSVPPSPVDSAPSPLSATPRDPRLPPADYLLYKDMYDDAMIKMHGKLPAEWVAYTHRHFPSPNRI